MKNSQKHHPSVRRVAVRAPRTVRDLIDYLRDHPSRVLPLDCGRTIQHPSFHFGVPRSQMSDAERAKRRAAADPKFRKSLRAKLRPYLARSIAAADKYIAALPARKFAAAALSVEAPEEPVNMEYLRISPRDADTLGAPVCRRGKDWEVVGAERTYQVHAPGETTWKNGRAVAYSRAENISYVRAVGLVLSPERVAVSLHGRPDAIYPAPEGMRWDIDEHGLRLVSARGDYHPSATDFLAQDPVAECVANLNRLADVREKAEAEARAEIAAARDVEVCLADSLRAGNCLAGSLAFAESRGLDTRRHFAPALLIRLGGDSLLRVRLAVRAAVTRHRAEMERGYSVLAEHRAA